mmetsp:Transcript_5105/g.21701  ORF Transcript_5105/g.21701 Transcript_5105/m.21701 type:complete len:213 (-) Transcript_5105:199-837(-)
MALVFKRSTPSGTSAVPNRAVREGYTQSYMSAPSAVHSTRSSGYPTPITYRGLSFGSAAAHCDTTLQNALFSSPPARPPMAYPGKSLSRFSSPSMQSFLRRASSPPCTIPKSACFRGLACAAMHRSIHRIVRCVASSKRSSSAATDDTTSSSAMMMSAPMSFWICIDFSGVKSICCPSTGLWNVTPSSEMSARSSRLTIWNPPLSVSVPPLV